METTNLPIGPTGECCRILQVHGTRRCNLACQHCYSQSGPYASDELDAELVSEAITQAHSEGFNLVGFSGGEPLLYRPLATLLTHARALGMLTTVTTNGILLTKRAVAMLRGCVDLVAISLDGVPDSHNAIRGYLAFERMAKRLENVRKADIPFGFIFTLTQFNVHELRWVAQFALEQEASLLQIHPLEETGRAAEQMSGARPDQREAAVAYLQALQIQADVGDRMRVHIDLADREVIRAEPSRVFADKLDEDWQNLPLSQLVNPLVIEPDGTVVPIQYGFERGFALGNLHEAPLMTLSRRWRKQTYPRFRAMCRSAWKEATGESVISLFNWYELVGAHANSSCISHIRSNVNAARALDS